MSTVFTLNPIKINLISSKNIVNKTIVFIGSVPNEVKSALLKIEKSGKYNIKDKVLSKFYGKKWFIKLGIKKNLQTIGGDAFSFDFSDTDTTDTKDTDTADTTDTKDTDDKNIISIEDLDEIEESSVIDISTDDLSDNLIPQIIKSKGNIKFIFDDPYITLYPEDNILEFKEKLYAILQIPIFRQHIWYIYQGRTYPLNYTVFNNEVLKYVNAQDMLSKLNDTNAIKKIIEGMPINEAFHQRKSTLKIKTNDTFSILDDFYHTYNITEYNLLDLDEFINPSRNNLNNIISDKYQIELIYYGFIIIYWPMLSLESFIDYIKSPDNIPKFYPDLQLPLSEIIQRYKMEKKIIDEKNDLLTNIKKKEALRKIYKNVSNSITNSIISLLTYAKSDTTIVLIRKLFDVFPLDKQVVCCKCYFIHKNRKIILNKKYKDNDFINDCIDMNSIMFKIMIDPDSNRSIKLSIFKNGNYTIKSVWREEEQYGFNDIIKKCYDLTKDVIEKINSSELNVLLLNKKLPLIDKHNIKFTEIGMSIFYRKMFTAAEFNDIKDIMQDFKQAGILINKSIELNLLEYYFSKGMFQYNSEQIEKNININNYYEFLTEGIIKQKWYTIFKKTRLTKIFHRSSDIKIEIVGIKENEFYIFYNYIITLFYLFSNKSSRHKSSQNNIQNDSLKKSLKDLKEQDPILYNFKNKYKSKNVYSKICQKPYQPLLLNKQAYDLLPKDKKEKAVKYWNFTTNKDVYYSCPTSKYPFIKYIVNKHPKNYCIPCCKKTEISKNNKDAKRIIYDICSKTHVYEKVERTITVGSRYIMSYGKDVEPGRLSRLPEDSLEPLFYETFSLNSSGFDYECIENDGYYLYGVEQNINNIHDIGIIIILINATETNIYDFIKNIIKLLKISPNKFKIILDGNINKYFGKLDDFIRELSTFINQEKLKDSHSEKKIPWNEIFISIAYLFLNINIVYFEHIKQNINLILPSYITNKEQFASNIFTNLLILKKGNKYFPIYKLNIDVFFKVKMISQKLFKHNDPIMNILGDVVLKYFNNSITSDSGITLDIINLFVKDNKLVVKKLFVNKANLCYYINILYKNNNIYIPVELSSFLTNNGIKITYEPFLRKKYNVDINTLLSFTNDFNAWVAKKSEKSGLVFNNDKSIPLEQRVKPIYPYIKADSWLVLCNINNNITNSSQVIGFTSGSLNYYVKNISLSYALKLSDKPVMQILYDPDIINQTIYINPANTYDNRSKKIGKSLYENYLYKIVLFEFIDIFNNEKNIQLRKKIKQILLQNLNNDYNKIINDISKCIDDCDDCQKIKKQIYEFINVHHSKNLLFKSIDESIYNFDKAIFECIKKLPRDKVYKELERISKRFVVIGDVDKIKDFEFPNIISLCKYDNKHKQKYCKNNKLIITKENLKSILEVLSYDILNPFKEKWLFNPVFTDNIINMFKFIKRPDELITIEIID